MTYLTEAQITEMADAAFISYEMAASWKSAQTAAAEYAQDEFGVRARKSAVLLAIKLARAAWYGETIKAKKSG